jgi:hypothetical protein
MPLNALSKMFRHESNGYRSGYEKVFSNAMEVTMRGRGIIGVIVLVWLLIGVFAAWQRGYFKTGPTNCASTASIAMTVIAGPLNYKVNPAVNCNVDVPQPK